MVMPTRVTRNPDTWWKFMSMSASKQNITLANLQANDSYITSMEREKEKSKATKAKAVTSKVRIGQIALVIEKMNSDNL